jgi:bacterioferritin-associated ferredoxin
MILMPPNLKGEPREGRAPVYICVCNALNERKVDEAIAAGARSVARIYRYHGCAPKCGKCIPLMRERLREALAAEPDAEAAVAVA